MQYYNKSIETASYDELFHLKSFRLSKTVKHVYENVPLYRQRMDEAGISPDDIKSADDLYKLPFTQKQDLRDTYPYGMFAVPREKLVRIHASSGTTGKQTVVGYTQNDIDIWSECVARALVAAGATKDDFVHVSYGYGMFTGGLGLHYGAEKLGATVIPASSGNTARQITMIQDFGSSILCCTPSYALYISDILRQNNIDPKTLRLKAGIFGAEPWSENMRREIETRLGIRAHDIYGLSEICGPGVSFDCEYRNGLHVNEDNFIIEIIDPQTGRPLPDGESGEVVFTCITKEALPLIRYNTHDISSITHEKCGCGRTLVRMNRITGRSDDMLIIRGVNVFPSQIESVLLSVGQVEPHYMIIVDRQNNLDTLEIKVEMSDSAFSDKVRGLEELEKKIKSSIDSVLGISAKITFVEANTIQRSEGKAKRVIDNRKF
jgi:phenylacetate-CoA ligase